MSSYWQKKMDELNGKSSSSTKSYWKTKKEELDAENERKKRKEQERLEAEKEAERQRLAQVQRAALAQGRGPLKDPFGDDIAPVRNYGTRVFNTGGIGGTHLVPIVAPATPDRETYAKTLAYRKFDERQATMKLGFKQKLEEEAAKKAKEAENAAMYANYKKLQEDRENKTGRFADEEEKERTWFQANAFKDVDSVGDALVATGKTIGGTLGDIGVNVVGGAASMVEGIIDFGAFMAAKDIEIHTAKNPFLSEHPIRIRGKEKEQLEARENLQSVAGDIRDFANADLVGDTLAPAKEWLDKGSLLGDKSDSISQGLGQIATIYFTGGLGSVAGLGSAGASALTTGSMFASSAGQGISEAYAAGASDNQAMAYGMLKGIADAGSELLFGGLGKGVNALGVSRGLSSLDDMFAKKLSDAFSKQVVKNFVEFGVKSSFEGVEEVLAGLGTAAAQKLTYMSDEELSQLIKDQDLREQFIVGTVTSFLAQSGYIPGTKNGSLRESNKMGRDFITGYTQSEQSVIDRELADRIAELEKDGEKLSEKDKKKLLEEVQSDVERGFIDTDKIEEILGGDRYTAWKDADAKESEMIEEYERLADTPSMELSRNQQKRLDELEARIENLRSKPESTRLRGELSSSLSDQLKNSRLNESYNERVRRREKFVDDVSKYENEAAKKSIQNLIDIGYANNSNAVHDFAENVAKMAEASGQVFSFVTDETLREMGKAKEGRRVNGFIDENGITVNLDSRAWEFIVGHEVTHAFDKAKSYGNLHEAIKAYAEQKGEWNTRLAEMKELYEGQNADAEAELVSDLVGEYLFGDADFINSLSTKHQNVFQKMYAEIKHLLKMVTAGSKQARQLERAKYAFEKAMREGSTASVEGTQHSLSAETDKAYTDAVNRGDTETAQRMVDEAAKAAGYEADHLYHGTAAFGFTSIDTNQSDDNISFFATTNVDVAQGYFPFYENEYDDYHDSVREIGKKTDRPRNTLTKASDVNTVISAIKEVMPGRYDNARPATREELLRDLSQTWIEDATIAAQELSRYSVPKDVESLVNSVMEASESGTYEAWKAVADRYPDFENIHDIYYNGLYWAQASSLWHKIKSGVQMTYKAMKDVAIYNDGEILFKSVLADKYNDFLAGEGHGIYDLYANHDNQLVIRGWGANWNDLPLRDTAEAFNKWWVEEKGTEPPTNGITTRDICEFAKAAGYRSVRFDEIHDTGPYGYQEDISTVYAFFYPDEDIKSADPITYDDNGNVIPLSERFNATNEDIRYSLSADSDGKELTKGQQEYFKDSKARDDNGALKLVYHASPTAGYTVFDGGKGNGNYRFGKHGGSVTFFTDSKEMSDSYAPSAERMSTKRLNKMGDARVSGQYEGYLNIKNPLVVDAEGRYWSEVEQEFSPERFAEISNTFTSAEKAALIDLAEWENLDGFRAEINEAVKNTTSEASRRLARAYNKFPDMEALYDMASDGFSDESIRRNSMTKYTTNDIVERALKDGSYDGVIIKNVVDYGGHAQSESRTPATDYIAFDSNQFKARDNKNPTGDADIRYSLSKDSEGRELSEGQIKYFGNSVVRDNSGKLIPLNHGTNEDFHAFDFSRIGKNGKAEGFGFYFSDDPEITKRYGDIQKEVYLNITKPLSKTKRTIKKTEYARFVNAIMDLEMSQYEDDGLAWQDTFISNYVNTYERGMTRRLAAQEFVNQVWDFNENDVDLIYEIANGSGKTYSNESMREFYDVLTDTLGYDGIIAEWEHSDGISKVYVTFNPEQSKYVTNTEPSTNEDMRYSLSRIGEDVVDRNAHMRLHPLENLLPVREDANVQESAKDARSATDEDVMPMPEAEQRIDLKYLMEDDEALPVREDTQAAAEAAAREGLEALTAPTTEAVADVTDTNVGDKLPTPETAEATPITTVGERLSAKKGNYETELESNKANRAQAWANYDAAIAEAQAEYDGLKNKNTKRANNLLRRIDRYKRQQKNVDADYAKRISDIEKRIGRKDAELQKDHTRADNLERAYARIDRDLEAKKAALAESFAQRRAELTRQIGNRNAFISSEAGKLYDELTNLRKGVRASKDLGYLLDLGYDWKSLKAGLAQARAFPDRVVNTSSDVEAVVRESLLRSYEARTEELADLDNERSRAEAQLDMEAEIERDSARKAEDILRRTELHENYVNDMKAEFSAQGFDLDTVLRRAKNLSTFKTVDNTPQRVMQKTLGYKEGDILADITVNRVAQNETEAIKWLNSFTDRKDGVLAKLSRKYNIKPGSRKSMAAQMYAEGYYVNDKGEYVTYGDRELAADFPNVKVQENIKGLAHDPIIRRIYDETLDAINESRVRNAYPEIQRLNNYFLHFQAMDDAFSRLGIPFNPNDIKAKDLPTDINGMTVDLKPGQPYFASAQHRKGIRTTFDLLGGLEKYLTSAKNQIYHIDDIQKLRALRNYIADDYGQAKGLESLDALTEEEAEAKIKQVFGSHLSTFAKFLNEEANILAGKTALIDRGLEGIIGRRGLTFIGDINKQAGANQVGYNISSSLTNFLAPVQAFAKTNKFDFVKGFTQTVANRLGSIIGKGDGFENSVMVRREGAERFNRTFWQKIADPGYALMGAVDSISTEIIARAKYNELTRKNKNMTSEQAHFETDKWVSALMADRSLGQMPQIYNSKMLGLITKYQLEVRNQLDSMVYDTINETKLSNEEINNKLMRNAKTAAKVASTWFALAVAQNLFGKAFEAIAGYNPAFDIIEVISTALGWDDDDESEDTVLDNVEQGFLALLEDLPYTSVFLDGGRIPVSSLLPVDQFVTGKDKYGREVSRMDTLKETLPYYVLPGGYGQIKKTTSGLKMFGKDLDLLDGDGISLNEDLPVSGSYTDKGALRFPVEKTPWNVAQAALFGQWASGNARDYFTGERKPLEEKQINEFLDADMTIQEYWDYREGLSGLSKSQEYADYVNSLDIPLWKKNLFINNLLERKEPIDLTNYDKYDSLEEFDYAEENPEKYAFLEREGIGYEGYKALDAETKESWSWAFSHQDKYRHFKKNGIMPEDYSVYRISMLEFDDESDKAYEWEFNNPDKTEIVKATTGDVVKYREYMSDLDDLKGDKDENGKTISGSLKAKKHDYIFSLDLDYGQKCLLFKSEYPKDDEYNVDGEYNDAIVDYLNSRDDISYSEMKTILEGLGATVDRQGNISW